MVGPATRRPGQATAPSAGARPLTPNPIQGKKVAGMDNGYNTDEDPFVEWIGTIYLHFLVIGSIIGVLLCLLGWI